MFKIIKIATKLSEFRYMHFMKVALKKSMDHVHHSKSGKYTLVRIDRAGYPTHGSSCKNKVCKLVFGKVNSLKNNKILIQSSYKCVS